MAKNIIKNVIGYTLFFLIIFTVAFFCCQNFSSFRANAEINKSQEIGCKDLIEINFSSPMIVSTVMENIKIEPATEVYYFWKKSNQILAIKPKKNWMPEKNYSIKINSSRNILLLKLDKEFDFNTEKFPRVAEFSPKNGEKDVLMDIEDPIVAKFDRNLNDYKVRFVADPMENLVSEINDGKTEVKLLSKNEFKRGQKYSFEVYIKHKNDTDEKYEKIYETYFETKPLPPPTWDNNFAIRIEQAKKFTEAKILEGKYVDINLKSQVMTIFEDGKALDAYMVSSGKRGMDTPAGTFKISNKTPRAWSAKYGLYMPYWQALVPSGDFGIHELPEWPGGYKEGQAHLGTPVSHGCVRLGVGPAQRVYEFTEIGTPVVVHY